MNPLKKSNEILLLTICLLLTFFTLPASLACITPLEVCLNNLRQIDGAKEQLALEAKLRAGDTIDTNKLILYIKGQTMPRCSEGGAYIVGVVGVVPRCTVKGHSLAEFSARVAAGKRRHEWMTQTAPLIGIALCIGGAAAAWTFRKK